MSEHAAPEERLGQLHIAVADTLIEQLAGQPVYNDAGEEVGRSIDPRILSSAITFLNNNKITANPFLDDKISEIEKRLQERSRRFKAVNGGKAAARAAANE